MLAITSKTNSAHRRNPRAGAVTGESGFTLFELLIAMVIFMALIGVILVVGTRVLASNRERSTLGVIRAVELVFEDWQTQTQAKYPEAITFVSRIPTPTPTSPSTAPQLIPIYGQRITDPEAFVAPIIDARWEDRTVGTGGNWPTATTIVTSTSSVQAAQRFEIAGKEPGKPGDAPQPSLTLMLLAISEVVPLEQMLSGIDPKLLKRESLPAFGWYATRTTPQAASVSIVSRMIEGPVVRDAFGFPLRFVSPMAHGGYGAYTPVATTADKDWDNGRNVPISALNPLRVLPFNPSWYDQSTVISTGAAELRISRRGRPAGMADVTLKTQSGDADEGQCRNGRPYIYSVGADGDPRTEANNIYSEFPDFLTDLGTPRNTNP